MPDEKRKACPTSDRLLAWSQGRVSAEEQDRIAAHVVRCAACDAVLERLDGADDSVVRDLRRDDVARPADSDLERVLRQAEALRGSGPDEAPRGDGRLPNRLGRIRLEKCIGRGGMGDVYKGWHERFKRTVAVKVLSKKYRGRDAAARFQREIVATGRSMHENLVLGLDADQEGDHQYLVMEFVDGESFEALVRRRGPLPAAEVCDLIRQAARGLEHAHANGLVHRDVKPANLMQAKSGTVKVLDLGLARLVDDEPALQDTTPPGDTVDGSGAAKPLTCATGMMGTYGYVAPEQIRDARDADARSDVYSLGCTFYFLLTGRAPFAIEHLASKEAKKRVHQRQAPKPVLHRRPDLPLALASLVDRMLEKDPARRPQSMREVVAALDAEQAFREGFAEAPAPADEPRSEYLFVVQRPGKRLVALAALLAALAAGAVYANRDNLSSAWSATKKMLAGSDAARPASTPVVPGPPAKSPPRPPATARSVPVRRPTAPKATAGMAQATPSAPPGPAGAAGPVPERAPPVVVDALDGDGLFDATRPRSTAEAQAAQRQWAERLGQPVVETNSLGMQFAVIPPGRFLMGSAASDPAAAEHERPQVPATVSTPFRIAVHETTQSQWEAVMKTTPWMKTRQTHHYHARKGSDLPATYASWIEAMDFCRRLTDRERKSGRLAAGSEYTLPTEAQWEFACRAGTTTRYWFGDDPAELGRHAWYGGFEGDGNAAKERYAHRVGSKLPNAWGLFDVHGNAWEWCLDEYVANRRGGTDPVAPAIGSVRVLRGGGWDTGPNAARSANRMPLAGQQRSSRWSFRVAVVGVPPTKPLVLADDAAEPFDATRPRTAEEAASALRGFAERQGRPPVETNSIGMDLVLIPPGRFLRGGASDDPAAPVRDRVRAPVTVSHGFWIAARETTQAQWRSVMNSTPWAKKTYVLDDPAAPATYVTRGDAEVFCRRLTDSERKSGRLSAEFEYGLPTEAQWELACRAGTTTAYAFGDDPAELPKHGWFGGLDGNAAPQKDLHPKAVGRLAPNAWGLYDMHGNVYELCRDGYVELPPGGTDPCVTDRALPQVLRSGAWSRPAAACRSGFRASHSVEGGTAHIGFRVVVARVRPAVP